MMKTKIQIQRDIIKILIPMKMNGPEMVGEVMRMKMNTEDEEHGN